MKPNLEKFQNLLADTIREAQRVLDYIQPAPSQEKVPPALPVEKPARILDITMDDGVLTATVEIPQKDCEIFVRPLTSSPGLNKSVDTAPSDANAQDWESEFDASLKLMSFVPLSKSQYSFIKSQIRAKFISKSLLSSVIEGMRENEASALALEYNHPSRIEKKAINRTLSILMKRLDLKEKLGV